METKKPITDGQADELSSLLEKKFGPFLEGRRFAIESSVKEDGTYVTVILSNSDQSFYYPVEARMDEEAEEMTSQEAALFLVDYVDLYFDEYFEAEEELYIPIDWSGFEWDAVKFQMRGQVINRLVEGMADSLLKGAEEGQV